MSGFGEVFRGANLARSAVVGGGMMLHAVNTFIAVTVMPTVVAEIGGISFFAWATTLYVLGSLLGGASVSRLLASIGARITYRAALGLFAAGSLLCAVAPSMPVLLAGRLVQGLGAGALSALSFTMVRTLFAEPLWGRALALISTSWGVATLAGPAVGGIFAEYGAWRAAFGMMVVLAPPMLLLVELCLPRGLPRSPRPERPMAFANLALLAGSVMAVAIGSTTGSVAGTLLGLVVAIAGMALFVRRERAPVRLLPAGACDPATALGATYGAMSMLLVGINTEIFVPYFLQHLHDMRPLYAGYISALMSAGWTTGSVLSSVLAPARARLALQAGPIVMSASMVALMLLIPPGGGSVVALIAISLALALMGLGIGLCWPQMGSRVFAFAAPGDRDLAAGSITLVIMVTNAFGSALAGMVTGLAGMAQGEAASAAFALFAAFAFVPWIAFVLLRRVR
jgi:MFS family permease